MTAARKSARQVLLGADRSTLVHPRHASPSLVFKLATMGFDMMFIDCETVQLNPESIGNMARAAQLGGASPLLRVPGTEAHLFAPYLGQPVHGYMFPHVDDGATAMRVTQAVRTCRGGDAMAVVVMIESSLAIRNLDAILAVPGIDAIFVGSADLAQSLGHGWDGDHPAVIEATASIVARARSRGVAAGTRVSAANASILAQSGITFAYLDTDTLLDEGWRSCKALLETSHGKQ